jgi:SlyX protein
MNEERIIELEIRMAYQDDLIQALNQEVINQQKQIVRLEETCKLLNEKIKSLQNVRHDQVEVNEKPPHY